MAMGNSGEETDKPSLSNKPAETVDLSAAKKEEDSKIDTAIPSIDLSGTQGGELSEIPSISLPGQDPQATVSIGTRESGVGTRESRAEDSDRTINTGTREKAKLYPKKEGSPGATVSESDVEKLDPERTFDTGLRRKSQVYPGVSRDGPDVTVSEGGIPNITLSVADELSNITSIHAPDGQEIINELRRVFGDGRTREFLASVGSPVAQSTKPLDSLEDKVKGKSGKDSESQDYKIPLLPINHITPVYGLAAIDAEGRIVTKETGAPVFERELKLDEESQYVGKDYRALQYIIGQGGMGRMLKYRDNTGEDLVVKVILNRGGRSAAVDKFIYEGIIQNQLKHPNIVPVHLGLVEYEGSWNPAIAMKFVKGKTLGDILHERNKRWAKGESEGEYSLHSLLDMFKKVCQGVAFAHSKKIIHRDLKPANIMVGEFGEVLVIDWGMAKHMDGAEATTVDESGEHRVIQAGSTSVSIDRTIEGSVMGTPAYMSPEQALGKVDELDERSDVWALGCILYEILTGKRVIEYDSSDPLFVILGRVASDDYVIGKPSEVKQGVSKELSELCMLALVRDKRKRLNKSTVFVECIDSHVANKGIQIQKCLAEAQGDSWNTLDSIEMFDNTIKSYEIALDGLLTDTTGSGDPRILYLKGYLAELYLKRGERAMTSGDGKKIRESYERAKTINDLTEEIQTKLQCRIDRLTGVCEQIEGNFDNAIRYYKKALEGAKELDDLQIIGGLLEMIVDVKIKQFDRQKGEKDFTLLNGGEGALKYAIELKEKLGDLNSKVLFRLGHIYDFLQQKDAAFQHYDNAIKAAEANEEWPILLRTCWMKGYLALREDMYDEAEQAYLKAYRYSEFIQSKLSMANSALLLADVHFTTGNVEEGIQFVRKAIDIDKNLDVALSYMPRIEQLCQEHNVKLPPL